jgi:hypothetical protein
MLRRELISEVDKMESLTVIAPDRIGLLLEVTEALGQQKINIESISLEVVGRKAVIRLIVEKARIKQANELLAKKGFKTVESDTIILKLKDRPGELSKVAKILSDAGISTENVQIVDKHAGETLCAIRVSKSGKAGDLLKDYM